MTSNSPYITITNGTDYVNLLNSGMGWKLADPYWNPQIAQYKGGGSYVNSQLATGKTLVSKKYDNVVETIPLTQTASDAGKGMNAIHLLLELSRQAGDYWAEPYEYDPVWIELKLNTDNAIAGYSRIVKMFIPELTNPYGQPFITQQENSVMENISLVIEREPFWQLTKPGEIIGPLYNLIDNPDFELWTQPPGIFDNQPDSWNDIETTHITGQNGRNQTSPKFGNSNVKITVSGSTLAGAAKGITQIIDDVESATEYTIIAWVRSDGVTNGVGRILVTYSDQLELYRDSDSHVWTLYTGKITTGTNDSVAIHCEILTTAANTVGTIYIDGLMFIKGDWQQEAIDNILPYISGSHIVNHTDQINVTAGNINYVDAWNIPGNVDSYIRLEIENNTSPADDTNPIEIYNRIRIGQRRSNNILNFDNFHDPSGDTDTTASSDTKIDSIALSSDWSTLTTKIISGSQNVLDNEGRFRLYARVKDTKSSGSPTLETRVSYFIGTANVNQKNLDAVTSSIITDWHIVDLTPTKSLNLDRKFQPNPPGQQGYNIQMKRSTGTDIGRFDYSMVMPTDGGFVDAEISPSLNFGNALIIDNTGNAQMISGTNIRKGWKLQFNTGSPNSFDMKEYKGDLFLNTFEDIFRFKQKKWASVFNTTNGQFNSNEVYNGKLYVSLGFPGGIPDVSILETTDGESFTTTTSISGRRTVFSMKAFNGLLYVAADAAGGPYSVYTWDGSSLVLRDNNIPASTFQFEIYNNRLYLSLQADGGAGRVMVLNEDTQTFDVAFQLIDVGDSGTALGMKVFNGELYVGSSTNRIWKYNGNSLTLSVESLDISSVITMEVLNDTLYAGGQTGPVVSTTNGVTWSEIFDPESFRTEVIFQNDGILYLATTVVGGEGQVFTFAENDVQYSVATFKGTSFKAPSRTRTSEKRHRYFFSYDRENFINNIDDKALIGIGFVPRYLEPPTKDN